MGAWIETTMRTAFLRSVSKSRTLTWVRGLKHFVSPLDVAEYCRTLTWVRGLKLWQKGKGDGLYESHPYMGAWIETSKDMRRVRPHARRTLTWVRGLKRSLDRAVNQIATSHPYMGAWIETTETCRYSVHPVTSHPYMGAWIETAGVSLMPKGAKVAPLHGCVD